MKALFDFILRFGNLNPQQMEFITAKAKEITVPKDGYFSEAGKVAKQVGFVMTGILRVCYYNNRSEEITKYFIEENNLVVDLESFDNQICSSAYVQAVTDCQLIVFERKDWLELLQTIVGFDAIVHKIISRALMQKVERRSPLVSEDATTRYLKFMEIYPSAVNRIPLSYIASYLGVTQSSLSRIRKNVKL